jgi:LEA14-like dessication related protein
LFLPIRDEIIMVRTVLAVIALSTMLGCASKGPREEPLHVSLVAIEPLQFSLLEQRYALKLRVQNPRPYEVPLHGVSLDLSVNGAEFGRGTGPTDAVLPPFGEEVIEITAVTSLQDVISGFRELSRLTGDPVRYKLQGRLYTGAIGHYERFDQGGNLRLGPPQQNP